MNVRLRVQKEKSEKEEIIAEFKRLKANIDGALKIQAERGNEEAVWIRKHL
jgi:ElaB/YqjD/DUF883 family membrane-anchored ribosome-binding protein